MRRWVRVMNSILLALLILCGLESREILLAQTAAGTTARTFTARGVILEIKPDKTQIVIRHEAVANYMAAMTMPFPVKNGAALAGLRRRDEVEFQLHVAETESWVDHFVKIGTVPLDDDKTSSAAAEPSPASSDKSLLDYKFTNELGQAVSFNDFRGQALAITFFYTRCPLPDYCPRLSRNFEEASQKLEAMTNAPANWHFISVSFDPAFDTPETLRNYGQSYGYDPARWSFFTGPADKIAALARGAGVQFEADNGTINHNFRTLIIDPQGHLQTVFPISGDLSDQIVSEIIKAASVHSRP
jgi:protein SCO1